MDLQAPLGTVDPAREIHETSRPVTEEGRARLNARRNRMLARMRNIAIVTMIVSVPALIIGIVTITRQRKFPYNMAGAAIAGGLSIFIALFGLCMVQEARGLEFSNNRRSRSLICYTAVFFIFYSFALCGILLAFGLSGIWGLIECMNMKQGNTFINVCVPENEVDTNIALSALTLTLTFLLLCLTMALSCVYCCNTVVFGVKTRYDRYSELAHVMTTQGYVVQQSQQYSVPSQPPMINVALERSTRPEPTAPQLPTAAHGGSGFAGGYNAERSYLSPDALAGNRHQPSPRQGDRRRPRSPNHSPKRSPRPRPNGRPDRDKDDRSPRGHRRRSPRPSPDRDRSPRRKESADQPPSYADVMSKNTEDLKEMPGTQKPIVEYV